MASNSSFELPPSTDQRRDERLSRLRRRWDAAITTLVRREGRGSKALESSRADALSAAWFQGIIERYSESGRAYHTLVHLEEMFGYLDIIMPAVDAEVPSEMERRKFHAAVSLAVFFHDAVYNAKSLNNEDNSAALYQDFSLRLCSCSQEKKDNAIADDAKQDVVELDCNGAYGDGEKDDINALVVRYILATKSHAIQSSDRKDPALLAFLDADMSVLGKFPEAYDAYASCIRREYADVPREVYCEKRAEILEGFLSQGDVFVGSGMKQLERNARGNLEREVELLRKGIIPNENALHHPSEQ